MIFLIGAMEVKTGSGRLSTSPVQLFIMVSQESHTVELENFDKEEWVEILKHMSLCDMSLHQTVEMVHYTSRTRHNLFCTHK